jgi:hypothetical protein
MERARPESKMVSMAFHVLSRHCVSLYLVSNVTTRRCVRSGGVLRAAAVARHVAALAD